MHNSLSIIIPTYNRDDSLPRVLDKLFAQEKILREYNAEILVVDDGSTDGTKEIATEFAQKFTISFRYLYQENAGSASARNFGIKESRGEILLFLDSDVIPSDALIPEHMRFHRRYPHGCHALRGTTRDVTAGKGAIWKREVPDVEELDRDGNTAQYLELRGIDLRSGNVSLKKDFVQKNGFFDPEMPVLVDPEWGYRLGKAGLRLFHSNRALGLHEHPYTFRMKFKGVERYGRAAAIWHFKSPEIKQYLLEEGMGKNFGFFTWKHPLPMLKHLLSKLIINHLTTKGLIRLGDLSGLGKNGFSRWCYNISARHFYRKGYREQMGLMRQRAGHD